METALHLRTALFGVHHSRRRVALAALAAFFVSLAGHAAGVFEPTRGVVLLPFWAAVVGVSAAVLAGLVRWGLANGCLLGFAALFGFLTEDAFLGSATVADGVSYLLRPEVVGTFAVMAALIGTVGFLAGTAGRLVSKIGRRAVAGADG